MEGVKAMLKWSIIVSGLRTETRVVRWGLLVWTK